MIALRLQRSSDGGDGNGGGNTAPSFDPSVLNTLEGDKFLSIFPEEIRTKGYMKDVKNFDSFVKKFDGAQSLLGEREVPTDQDPPEKWNKFFDKIGRPKTHTEYKFDKFEGLPEEYTGILKSEGILKGLWEAGLSNKMANNVMKNLMYTIHAAEQAESVKADEQYNKLMDETFGQDRKIIETNAKALLAANIDPKLKPYFEDMDEKSLAIIISAVNGIVNKYAGQDAFRKGTPGASDSGQSKDALVSRMREIMSKKEYSDPFINKNEHTSLKNEMETIREKLKKF